MCYMHLQKLEVGEKNILTLLKTSVAYTTLTKDVLFLSGQYNAQEHYSFQMTHLQPKK